MSTKIGIASETIADFFVEDIKLGFYSEKLKPWLDVFGPSRIHIVDGSNLVKNPDVEYQKIMEFINDAVKFMGLRSLGMRLICDPKRLSLFRCAVKRLAISFFFVF